MDKCLVKMDKCLGMPPDQGNNGFNNNGTMPGMPPDQGNNGFNNNGTMPGVPPDQGQTNNGTNPGTPGENQGSNVEIPPDQGPGNNVTTNNDDDNYDVYTTDGLFMKLNSIYLIMAVLALLNL